jgi:hypothetical protein
MPAYLELLSLIATLETIGIVLIFIPVWMLGLWLMPPGQMQRELRA